VGVSENEVEVLPAVAVPLRTWIAQKIQEKTGHCCLSLRPVDLDVQQPQPLVDLSPSTIQPILFLHLDVLADRQTLMGHKTKSEGGASWQRRNLAGNQRICLLQLLLSA